MFRSLKMLVSNTNISPLLFKQIHASKTFFDSQLPSFQGHPLADKGDLKRFKGPIFNITRLDAHNVVSGLSSIVNDEEQFKTNKTFYLLIQGNPEDGDEFEELFRLQARPTPHQPGNGIVFLRPRGRKTFKRDGAKSYEELNGALKAHYETDTKQFAEDIKKLFKNNAQIDDLPEATSEAYMILLYEIGRRLVKSENPSDRKEAFDVLPIGGAIARVIKLLERGACLFEDVFLPGGRFHCFTGKPEVREKAIENINQAIAEITKQETEEASKQKQAAEEDFLIKELEELFCAGKPSKKEMPSKEGKLKEEFKALMIKDPILLPVLYVPDLITFYEE